MPSVWSPPVGEIAKVRAPARAGIGIIAKYQSLPKVAQYLLRYSACFLLNSIRIFARALQESWRARSGLLTLFSNDTLTALVGIVPNLQGSVVDPIRFKLITGNTNLATNGLYLPPGVKNIVWSGIAIGNREMSCVRGELHSVTFTFEDGTIRTVNSQADSGKSKLGGNLLGYISTQKGNPCLPGRLITNAQDYLMDRMWASGVAAAADGFSDTQTTTQRATDGTLTQYFSGNSGDYVASRTLAGSLTELTDYLRERQAQAIDLVFVESGQDVVVHVETQIEIDYDPQGRRLDHGNQVSTTDRLSYQLD